jgi:epoxyqueuosine reductase
MSGAMVLFEEIAQACAAQGLSALATIELPESCDATGLEQMLSDGVGDMEWMEKTRDLRVQPRALLPSARSLLVVALPYQPEAGSERLRRARYAAGKDYHGLFRAKLARVGDVLAAAHAMTWQSRACVDSAPLNERTLARLAGLGWIGKNALLISPKTGSYRLLGFLLSEAPFEIHRANEDEDRCGSCTACERRCPTKALVGRRVLSERCISYLTIEHRGVISKELAKSFEGWWFGCDLCQEACPWNRFAPEAGDPRLTGSDRDDNILAVTAESFDTIFAGRAIRRIGYERFRRNLLVALWSLGNLSACEPIIAEGLELVLQQALELGLSTGSGTS